MGSAGFEPATSLSPAGRRETGSTGAHDVREVDLVDYYAVTVVGGVQRTQRLLVRPPRGLLVPPCVVGAAELERGEAKGWVQIQGPPERADGRRGFAQAQLGETTHKVGVGVEWLPLEDLAGDRDCGREVAAVCSPECIFDPVLDPASRLGRRLPEL